SENMASNPAPTATVTLSSGNVDLAARAAANAAISSADVANVNPASSGSAVSLPVRAQSLPQLLLGLTSGLVADRVTAQSAPAATGIPKVQALITHTEPCSAGGTVNSVLDDRDNSGAASSGDVLTVTFVQCKPSATDLIDGSVTATYSVVQQAPLFATAMVTYSHLQASSTDGSFSIDGSFTFTLTQVGVVTTEQL